MGYFSILANGDELHFGSDDALARVPELRHGMTRRSTQRFAARGRAGSNTRVAVARHGVLLGKKTIVSRLDSAPVIFFHLAAVADPVRPPPWTTLGNVAVITAIAPRTA